MLRRAAELPGNPYDVEVREHGGIVATRVGQLPRLPWYNTLVGLGNDNLHLLDEVLEIYTAHTITPTITLWATRLSPEVGAALFDRGFTTRAVSVTLYATPEVTLSPGSRGVEVIELAIDEPVPIFDEVMLAGYEFDHPAQQALASLENNGPEVRRYLALIDGQPAAAAVLTHHDGIAYLAGAATLSGFRERGAQAALIQRRLIDAAEQSEVVAVTTAFASQSQQNLERFGFNLAHLKTLWVPRSSLE
jgi:hypothetical protein